MPRNEQSQEVGTELFYGGSVLPMDASLHPGAYHAGLMARVVEAGGRVHANMPVRAIDSERQRHVVRFNNRSIQARDVLVATNGYTNGVGAYFRKRIIPVISAQIATGPIAPQLLGTLMPKRRVCGNTNRVFFYFRCAPGENRLIWGGRAANFAAENSTAAYAHLARDLLRVFPSLDNVQVSHAWSGTIGYTFDEFPHLGRAPSRRILRDGLLRYRRFARHTFWPQDCPADARQAGGPLGFRRPCLSEPSFPRVREACGSCL